MTEERPKGRSFFAFKFAHFVNSLLKWLCAFRELFPRQRRGPMKHFKLPAAFLFALLLAISLAACGDAYSDDGGEDYVDPGVGARIKIESPGMIEGVNNQMKPRPIEAEVDIAAAKAKAPGAFEGTNNQMVTRKKADRLAPVGGVTVEATAPGNVITWKPVLGAQGYEIYRAANTMSRIELIGSVEGGTTTTFTDPSPVAGKRNLYKVRATKDLAGIKRNGNLSAFAEAK